MNLFQLGCFHLAGGQETNWKIECDALKDEDWQTLASIIARRYGFGGVSGVPRGGMKLEALLRPHASQYNKNYLIVDDVYTTGGSMNRMRDELVASPDGGGRRYLGVVVFARAPIVAPNQWISALFQMS